MSRAGPAVERYQALLADVERFLGADHTDTLATRRHLARWQAEIAPVGRAAE